MTPGQGGAGVGTPNVSVYRGVTTGRPKSVEKRVRVAEAALRCLACGLAALAAALVGSAGQTRLIFSLEKTARFTDMKALVFLEAANGIAAGYSLLQATRCVVGAMRGSVLSSRTLAWAIFSCDQVTAYVTVAAAATAMQSAVLGEFGQPELQWMKTCSLYRRFCTQIGEGIASAFLVSLTMVILSGLSAFNLFRLYGGCKGGN